MRLKKELPYNIKKALTIFGLTGASLFMAGCNKDDEPTVPTEPITPTVDVVVEMDQLKPSVLFYDDENDVRHPSKLIQGYVADPRVRTVYLKPNDNWYNYKVPSITGLRKNTLEMLLNYSDKIKGVGDFNFALGEASKVPEDSLWYVDNGWTINKYRTGPWAKGKSR